MTHKLFLVLTALVVFLAACDKGGDNSANNLSPAATTASAKLNFIKADAIAIGQTLPILPANDNADMAVVMKFQATRTQADCVRANTEVNYSLATFFGPPYGTLSKEQIDAWSPFFLKLTNDVNFITDQEKTYWGRMRPYEVSNAVQPCLPPSGSASYPSGHSTLAHTFAAVLSSIDPGNQTVYQARADQIAEDRVMGGVHFPSDIAAGKILAAQLYRSMLQNPAFVSGVNNLH
jgi:acid phosphatase (class A)